MVQMQRMQVSVLVFKTLSEEELETTPSHLQLVLLLENFIQNAVVLDVHPWPSCNVNN